MQESLNESQLKLHIQDIHALSDSNIGISQNAMYEVLLKAPQKSENKSQKI